MEGVGILIRREEVRDDELITKYNPKSPAAEAYRSLRTNISFLSPDQPLKTIALTSSSPEEGKSLTTANLAISIAQEGKRVIIIDADLRKPMQHRFFKMTNHTGLSKILTDKIEFAGGLRESGVEGVQVVSSGPIPPNPVELIGSAKMKEVIKAAEAKADLVLIDTPPVIAVTDTTVLADKVDGFVLVVASQMTSKEVLIKARETLDKVRANVIGTVLNRDTIYYGNEKYYDYYYYGERVNA